MSREERNDKLKHLITCIKCEVSGKCCDEDCPTQYEAGNMGEIIENLEEISKILEQETSEDCVSRRKLEKLKKWRFSYDNNTTIPKSDIFVKLTDIRTLPPVNPTRKKGKWIFTKTVFDKYGCTAECPSCHKKWKTYDEIRWKKENKFCPNCGEEKGAEE